MTVDVDGSQPFVYSSIALLYSFALKNLLPAALHDSASTAGFSCSCSFAAACSLCGGGAGAASCALPLTPLVSRNAPGVVLAAGLDGDGVGDAVVSLSPSMLGGRCLSLCRDSVDSLLRSSGGRFSGCESGSNLRGDERRLE